MRTTQSDQATSGRTGSSPTSDALAVDVIVSSGDWSSLAGAEARVLSAAVAIAAHAKLGSKRLIASVALASDNEVRALNAAYRSKDKATNVLSFPAIPPRAGVPLLEPVMLGDVIIAAETLQREARELAVSPGDHLSHLVVHGLLHLLGHDHEDETAAAEMEGLETRILASLGIADPYSDDPPAPAFPGSGDGDNRQRR